MNNYQRIRDLREDSDMTQKEVAEKLFMHLTQYRRYESGESEIPFCIAIKLAKLYNVSLDYIAGITNEKSGFNASSLNELEKELISGFRQLNTIGKGRILERIEILFSQQKTSKTDFK